ncbi:MAG: hypothetical protein Ct9H300mP32_4360 [Verrucomicrobiota bacterium]|nr:MAG: hypothetical protein Ct9H300mP32_4360 [Verrucomicrobiota bacterium]
MNGETIPAESRSFDVFRGYPGLRGLFQSHREYAGAGVLKLMDHHPSPARSVTAAVLQSMVFLNRVKGFEPKPLPPEASCRLRSACRWGPRR